MITLSDQFKTAAARALYGGLLTAAAAGIATYSTQPSFKNAGIAAASAFVAYLIARGGVEGYVDTSRATAAALPKVAAP